MNVCILGVGLTSLTLAKALVNLGINVDVYSKKGVHIKKDNRTLGISKSNIDFINENIVDIKKLQWKIKKIEIYSDALNKERILNFENSNEQLFSVLKNHELISNIFLELKKNKLFKLKKMDINKDLFDKDYNLIINSDSSNFISKKFFYKRILKEYKSYAYTSVIRHKEINNNIAIQIFTNNGPLAFLPISESETSVVFSKRGYDKIDFDQVIKKYNLKYKISKIGKTLSFELKSTNLRSYFYKNILAFGDLLHQIHPLAGQGFNMSIRDIKVLTDLIKFRVSNGLELDSSICREFEKKMKHKNFLFSNGIDFIYEIFNIESKINKDIISKSAKALGKNKYINNFFTKVADTGIII